MEGPLNRKHEWESLSKKSNNRFVFFNFNAEKHFVIIIFFLLDRGIRYM